MEVISHTIKKIVTRPECKIVVDGVPKPKKSPIVDDGLIVYDSCSLDRFADLAGRINYAHVQSSFGGALEYEVWIHANAVLVVTFALNRMSFYNSDEIARVMIDEMTTGEILEMLLSREVFAIRAKDALKHLRMRL
jgi:hypothetical protein